MTVRKIIKIHKTLYVSIPTAVAERLDLQEKVEVDINDGSNFITITKRRRPRTFEVERWDSEK